MAKKTKCEIAHDNAELLDEVDELRENDSEKTTLTVDESKELVIELKKQYKNGDVADIKEVDKILDKLYPGKKNRTKRLAAKIYGLLEANESLKRYINGYVMFKVPPGVKIGVTEKKKVGNKIVTKRKIMLSKIPYRTLKVIYNEALKPSRFKSKKGLGIMNFDGVLSHLIVALEKGYREPSGAYWMMQWAVEKYPTDISARISKFSTESFADEAYGMNLIYQKIRALKRFHKGVGKSLAGEKYTRFFSRYMMGQIHQDPDTGVWMIYQDYQVREYPKGHPKEGQLMRYESTNDVMFSFQNPIELSKYVPDNLRGVNGDPINKAAIGAWNVTMDKNVEKEFFKLTKEARKIDDAVFEYMKKHMEYSLYGDPSIKGDKGLMGELHDAFKGANISMKQLKQIFFNPTFTASKNIIANLPQQYKKLYDRYFDVFGTMINDEFTIPTGNKILFPEEAEYRKHHWPVIYDKNVYRDMVRIMVKEMGTAVKKLDKTKKVGIDRYGNPLTPERISDLKTRMAELKGQIANAENILVNMLNYNEDNLSGTVVSMASDNKYIKRISNAYNIRNARSDDGVYYDYLKNVMSSIERNRLSGQAVKALRISFEQNDEKMDKIVSKEIINQFKTVFNTPDVEGAFSRAFPNAWGNVEKINETLNKWIPGRNKSAAQLNTTYKIMGNWVSGWYLGGLNTTAQNYLDMYRNVIYFGKEELDRGMEEYSDPVMGPIWKDLIKQSGLTEFSEFFSRSMVNGIAKHQLEQDVTEGILVAMLKFHSGKSTEEEMIKEFEFYLSKSNRIASAKDIVIVEDTQDIKTELADLKQKRRLAISNRLVSMAITRDFVFHDALKKRPIWDFATAGPKFILSNWLAGLKKHKFTMSDTERYIRSLSFIIGVRRAIATGALDGPIDILMQSGQGAIQEAIYYGKEHDRRVNFALSTQAMGKGGQGGFGKLWFKFKNWSHQKFAADHRIFKEAYTSMKSEKRMENDTFDPKAVAKTFGALFSRKHKRKDSNEVAILRQFILQQGLLTILFDVLSIGVFPALAPMRAALYYGTGVRALKGATSDYVSFIMMIPLLMLKGFFDDDEDDDEREAADKMRTMNYYLRKTQFGFAAVWTMDAMQALIYALLGASKNAGDKFLDIQSPVTGGSTLIGQGYRATYRKLRKKLFEED